MTKIAFTSMTNMTKSDYYTIRLYRISKSNMIIVKWFKEIILAPLKQHQWTLQ